jgi:hypothetical protein
MKKNTLSLEQEFAIAKMNHTIDSANNEQLKDLIRQLFVQNIHLMNEIKRLYLEDLGLEEVDLEDL